MRPVAAGRVIRPHNMYRDYVVQRHDDLKSIAPDLDTTPDELIEANHLRHPSALRPGEHLKVPIRRAYEVQSGDTIYAVARRFSITPAALAEINDLPISTRLRTGDQLALPSTIRDRGPQQEAAPVRLATMSPPTRYTPPPSPYVSTQQPSPYVSRGDATPRGGVYTPGASSRIPPASPLIPPPAEAGGPRLSDAQVVAMARQRFIWPVQGQILGRFGPQAQGVSNDGVDLRSPQGTPVRAAAPGEVVYAGSLIKGFGNLVLLRHPDGWVTAYAHLQHIDVQMQQSVSQGQQIGQVGSTGGVSEPQLHFEVRYAPSAGEKARPVDPLLVLPPGGGSQG